MARFSNCCLIPNLIPQTPNTLLHAATVQDEDVAIVVKSDIEAENTKF